MVIGIVGCVVLQRRQCLSSALLLVFVVIVFRRIGMMLDSGFLSSNSKVIRKVVVLSSVARRIVV